jgi:hypothetical protein
VLWLSGLCSNAIVNHLAQRGPRQLEQSKLAGSNRTLAFLRNLGDHPEKIGLEQHPTEPVRVAQPG